jgi:hypothetical protein
VTGAVIAAVASAVVAGILFAAGAGLFALVVIPIGLAVAGWFIVSAGSGRTPRDVAREAERPELLGPGGPDDPTSDRSER